ncbi:MAG: hypothetical protein P1U41_07405 [Vicingaceae bacterium]|nr:hypothetical protein [Vicingaceae bacterium]
MKTTLKIILTIVIGFFAFTANGQNDEILFLNGKILKGTLLDKTKYEFTFKDDKDKEIILDKYRIFSYKQNNQENIVYEYDTLSGNFLKVEDMKLFVFGERDAYTSFKPRVANIAALGIGAASGFMMQRDQSFVYIPIPLVYTAITLVFPTKVNQKLLTDTKYIKEDEYLRGYERIARSKRTQSVLRNSVIGMAAGFLVGLIVNGNDDKK